MGRETVDFGIDLGTTNSAVAASTGADAAVVRNNLQLEYTPSAVHITRSGNLHVGKRARDRIDSDPANTHAEFKLQMGVRGAQRVFQASGRTMTPEELSAEVLKSLRQDVVRALDEEIDASVITVPAAFELDQCDATRRAAGLAGLAFAPLIQEPTAAAWAYGARAADVPRRGFWLVFDFGGGTFDAAVIQLQDGEFAVVNHAGDNFLGGKLIDWALVDGLLVPAAREQGRLATLDRADPRHAGNIAKLKIAAENAKIELSSAAATEVELELTDDQGGLVEFQLDLNRAEVERVAAPYHRRAVDLCRRALTEKGLAPGDIERVVLVGGATLAPALRHLLADPDEGLGILIDHSLDPVTVVARGAAIFGRTQRVPRGAGPRPASAGRVLLDFGHRPTGRDADPLVGGRADAGDGRDWTGYTIEFTDTAGRPEWRSGQIPLHANGAFTARLRALAEQNVYSVELRTPQGTRVPTEPETTSYQRMAVEGGDSTLNHSVGVWLEGGEVAWILRKGSELPARRRIRLFSTVPVRRGERTGLIRVPIVQGERARADRNTVVGRLDIRPDEVARDVPAGSEIEVTVEIDRSVLPHIDAFIPILDEEFEIDVDLGREQAPSVEQLRDQSRAVAAQYRQLRERARSTRADRAGELLDEFDRKGGIESISRELEGAATNPDAPAACEARLREAESVLDEAEHALELPGLVDEAESVRRWVNRLAADSGSRTAIEELADEEQGLEAAVAGGDPTLVAHHTELVRAVGLRILEASGRLPVIRFTSLREHFTGSADPKVRQLLDEGEQALSAGDSDRLRAVDNELARIRDREQAAATASAVTTTVRQQP